MESVTTPSYEPVLCLAFELSAAQWKLAFSPGLGQRPRLRTISARDLNRLVQEIAAAKVRFGLPQETPVLSCYEAGRDGFWLHRALLGLGVKNHVVDSASIEVKRRKKKVKTDRLDAIKLVEMLLRYRLGETRVWKIVRVPSPEEEDRRQLHRELGTAKKDRRRVVCRIKSLLFTQGIWLQKIQDLPHELGKMRLWNGEMLPVGLRERLEREWERLQFADEQVQRLRAQRRALLRTAKDRATQCAAKLIKVASIGEDTGWLLSTEFYSWREFQNGRQIGGLAGLTPTPYQSGEEARELGISKAGNRAVRHIAIELAWSWLRYQPQSELSLWYQRRFGGGPSRLRRLGIVALARKLLIALWQYLETDVPPVGATLKA